MATKKKGTPADYDRWDTPPGLKLTPLNKPTAAQKKLAQELNAKAAAKKKKK